MIMEHNKLPIGVKALNDVEFRHYMYNTIDWDKLDITNINLLTSKVNTPYDGTEHYKAFFRDKNDYDILYPVDIFSKYSSLDELVLLGSKLEISLYKLGDDYYLISLYLNFYSKKKLTNIDRDRCKNIQKHYFLDQLEFINNIIDFFYYKLKINNIVL